MKRLFLFLAILLLLSACTSINMKYHHADEKNESYWMTVTEVNRVNGHAKAGLWYCQAVDRNAPVCTQAHLKACSGKDCDLEANSGVFDGQIDNPTSPKIIKHVGPEK